MPVLDKAKEIVVETIFRSRHKTDGQDRERDIDRQHSRDDVHEKGRSKDKDRGHSGCDQGPNIADSNRPAAVMVSSITQTPLKGADDVIVEFPTSAFSHTSPDTGCKSRKREYEADSNSGTWPKSRSALVISSTVPSTVTLVLPKDRPSIKDPFIFQPPQCKNSPESGGGYSVEQNGVCHSQQNSGSGGVKYPASIASAQPFVPFSKAPPHFSVGVMQAPSRAVGCPVFPKQRPGQGPPNHHQNFQYPRGSHGAPIHSYPQPRHQAPHPQTGPHSHLPSGPKPSHSDAYTATLQPHRVTPNPVGNSHRPTSGHHRGDKQWAPAPSWPHSVGPPTYSHTYSASCLPPEPGVPTSRPTSLEVPYPVRLLELPGEEGRVASPVGSSVGSGLSGRSPHSSSQHHYPGGAK